MFYSLFFLFLLINIISTEHNQCQLLETKLIQHGIQIHTPENNFSGLRLCQGLITDYCCSQAYEEQIQNATATELYHLFELYSIQLYQPLFRLSTELNDTISRLIETSRNETHFLFQSHSKTFYHSYRSSVDLLFNHLLTITHQNYQYAIKHIVDEFFRRILRISIELNTNNQPIVPSYLLCLWRNQPFGNLPNVIARQLEVNLGKLLYLNELFKLSVELIQVMSLSVITDHDCIDSYMQLSYCNLCSGQQELPCFSNCVNIIENCLVNISLINDVWSNFIDSLEFITYSNDNQKVSSSSSSSISTSILDALITFFNSDGRQSKDIINQCGYLHIRKEIFDANQKFHDEHWNSLSLFDQQLMSIRQSLQSYRSFWLMLPEQICKSDGISAPKEKLCWTGASISKDKRQMIRTTTYDQPLSLRLQWILKEISEKSQLITNLQETSTNINISTTTSTNTVLINEIKLNLTDDLDDYPNDDEFQYSDYAYEDSIDGLPSVLSTTTLSSSSVSLYDEILNDDINTVSYYDYGEQDVYSDEELDETSTKQASLASITTTVRIPLYHQRPAIIWNINIGDDDELIQQSTYQYNSSRHLCYSFCYY